MNPKMPILMLLLSVGISFSVRGTALGQDKKPGEKEDVIRVDTQLVDVPIAVVAQNGTPVKGGTAPGDVKYKPHRGRGK